MEKVGRPPLTIRSTGEELLLPDEVFNVSAGTVMVPGVDDVTSTTTEQTAFGAKIASDKAIVVPPPAAVIVADPAVLLVHVVEVLGIAATNKLAGNAVLKSIVVICALSATVLSIVNVIAEVDPAAMVEGEKAIENPGGWVPWAETDDPVKEATTKAKLASSAPAF